MFLGFLHQFDGAFASRAQCLGLYLLCSLRLTPHGSNVAAYTRQRSQYYFELTISFLLPTTVIRNIV